MELSVSLDMRDVSYYMNQNSGYLQDTATWLKKPEAEKIFYSSHLYII